MRTKRSTLAGFCLLSGIVWLGSAIDGLAQAPSDPRPKLRFQYAATFVCGENQGALAAAAGVLPGTYATAINIHNPNSASIALRKKIALSFPVVEGNIVTGGQVPGAVSFFQAESLGPDEALEVDCGQIPSDFTFPPSDPVISPMITFHKGFLVIESRESLDVSAVYTATSPASGARSVDVERIPERRLE